MDNPITEGAASAAEAIAGHPKVALAVSAVTTMGGAVSFLNEVQTALGLVSLVIGIAIGLYVLRINVIKRRIYQRMWDQGESLRE